MDERRDLVRDEKWAVRLSTGVLLLTTAIAIALAFEDVAVAVAVASFGLSTAVALFLIGERFGGLRLELRQAEAELRRAQDAVRMIEMLESIDARLEQIERRGVRLRLFR